MDKKTALYEKHVELGGKMVPFAGYLLPIQYKEGIIAEHNAVRKNAGLFDVSHMGEFTLSGQAVLDTLNHLLTNDFTGLETGRVRYSPMCYADGGTVDDLLVYKDGDAKYTIVVNAANREKDFEWMKGNLVGDAQLRDISGEVSQIALQGPKAHDILCKVSDGGALPGKYYSFINDGIVAGEKCVISRTGYTGEAGYELYCGNDAAPRLWDALLRAGAGDGLVPCGLGARNTLRLEAGMPLYGHEMSAEISPAEAGLGFFIKKDKPEFIGKEPLLRPRKRKKIGLVLKDRGVAREEAPVFDGGRQIGHITSGTMSPTLGKAIGMALVDASFEGTEIQVDVRGRRLAADVVKTPFVEVHR